MVSDATSGHVIAPVSISHQDEQSPILLERKLEIERHTSRVINRNITPALRPHKQSRPNPAQDLSFSHKRKSEPASAKSIPKRVRIELAQQDAIDSYRRLSCSHKLAQQAQFASRDQSTSAAHPGSSFMRASYLCQLHLLLFALGVALAMLFDIL